MSQFHLGWKKDRIWTPLTGWINVGGSSSELNKGAPQTPVLGAVATQNTGAGGREEGNGSSSEDEEPTPRQSKDNEYPASSRDNPLTARLGDSSNDDYKPDPFYDLSIMSRESGSSPGSSNLSKV
jgi:hypothetical protein